METLGIGSTGTLNYHLKVLGDLLEKTDSGQYRLSEKGKLASRFLTEFSEQDGALKAKKVWWRRFWVIAVILPAAWLLIVLYLHFSGYLDYVSDGASCIRICNCNNVYLFLLPND